MTKTGGSLTGDRRAILERSSSPTATTSVHNAETLTLAKFSGNINGVGSNPSPASASVGRLRPKTDFVFRAGFKLPRHKLGVASPSSNVSFGHSNDVRTTRPGTAPAPVLERW